MSGHNPHYIARALEDLIQEMERWTLAARETLAVASYTQRHATERVDRVMRDSAIVLDEAERIEELVARAAAETYELLGKCSAARAQSEDTLAEAQAALQQADSTLQEWEAELEEALAWLERAEARLARALEEYRRAQGAYDLAKSSYERAVSRYNACMNNKERSNCNSEASAVRAAEADLQEAIAWVRAAEQEVIAAREEVEMARARVACCRRAVDYASHAVSIAQEAEAEASQALNSAERGFEFARAAEKLVNTATEKTIAGKEAAESMMAAAREAVSLTDEAAHHLTVADKTEDSSQRYSLSARQELQYRTQMLHELNRPTLYESGGGNLQGVGKRVPVLSAVLAEVDKVIAGSHAVEYSPLKKEKIYKPSSVKNILKGDAGQGRTYVRLGELYDHNQIVPQPEGLIEGKSRPDYAIKSLTHPDMYEEIVDSKAWSLATRRVLDADGKLPPTLKGISPSQLLNIHNLKNVVHRYTSSQKLDSKGRLALYFPEEVLRWAPQIKQELESWSGTELAHGRKIEVRSMGVWEDTLSNDVKDRK